MNKCQLIRILLLSIAILTISAQNEEDPDPDADLKTLSFGEIKTIADALDLEKASASTSKIAGLPVSYRYKCQPSDRFKTCCKHCKQKWVPVCGWWYTGIPCLTSKPCRKTYANICRACRDPRVSFVTYGYCPNQPPFPLSPVLEEPALELPGELVDTAKMDQTLLDLDGDSTSKVGTLELEETPETPDGEGYIDEVSNDSEELLRSYEPKVVTKVDANGNSTYIAINILPIKPFKYPYYCKPWDRFKICTNSWIPACGWFGPPMYCFAYPCAATFSNVCTACRNKDVKFVSYGYCPQAQPIKIPLPIEKVYPEDPIQRDPTGVDVATNLLQAETKTAKRKKKAHIK
jgi:hypothetical protein